MRCQGSATVIYPAISIKQPWPWAIINAEKDIENRTWPLPGKYQGVPVLIHAGKTVDKYAQRDFELMDILMPFHGQCSEHPMAYSTGGIVGAVVFSVQDSAFISESKWAQLYCYHWHIAKAWKLPFYPCRGKQRFFKVDYPYEVPEWL